jgi:S-formylglutathione hydrolase FrmB
VAQPRAPTVTAQRVSARIVDLTVRSRALGTTAKVRLLTPDGWAARTTGRRWPVLYAESRAFVARLRTLRIPVRADLYGPGTHTWRYWQRDLKRSLPLLLGAS